MRISPVIIVAVFNASLFAQEASVSVKGAPLSDARRVELLKSLRKSLDDATSTIQQKPDSLVGYSQRGDAHFFLGNFHQAVVDYDKMNDLDPMQASSHWRRGIALFYDEKYEQAASQFESYHSFDQVDRENGIWRYLSQHKAYGRDKAREGLLKYQKDDREPFPAVYKLFSGSISPDQIMNEIATADVSKAEREKRMFYAELYIGLNHAVEGEDDRAQKHLALSTANGWAPAAGYGPRYMWHVGRVHEEMLRGKKKKESSP